MKETGDQSNDENELSPVNTPLSPKIKLLKNEIGLLKQSCIPKLDLTKAKQIQESNVKLAHQKQYQKNEPTTLSLNLEYIEKIKKLIIFLIYAYKTLD